MNPLWAKVVVLIASVFPLQAQPLPIQVACGSATDQYFVASPASFAWTDTLLQTPSPTLRFANPGQPVRYRIPVQPGEYILLLHFAEPTKTAAGQRSITVTINGDTSFPMDIFALAGGQYKEYSAPFLAVAGVGVIDVRIDALLGSAIISGIDVLGAPLTTTAAAMSIAPGSLVARMPDGTSVNFPGLPRSPRGRW